MHIPSMTISLGMNSNDMETELHRIESEAYGAVLRALTAQGGPTWDHLDTLYGLRKELKISETEHKDLIAKAKSDNLVIMMRQWRAGLVGEKQLVPSNINPPPPVSSASHASSKRLKTLHVSASSFSNCISDAQPLPADIPSSLVARLSNQSGGEAAVYPIRGSVVQPKKSTFHKREASIVSKGMIIQSKTVHQSSNVDSTKKRLATIEIRATNELIQEVQRLVYCGNYPNQPQVEKAKSLLKEQERAIIDALDKLAQFADSEDSRHHHEEQRRNGHQSGTPFALYDQSDMMNGYYNSGLNLGQTDGGRNFCEPERYLLTP